MCCCCALCSAAAAQYEAVFEKLREHLLTYAERMYNTFNDVLTYRGTDYASVLLSSNAHTAHVEYAEPVMRQVSHLLK